jgi:hypothetical protein
MVLAVGIIPSPKVRQKSERTLIARGRQTSVLPDLPLAGRILAEKYPIYGLDYGAVYYFMLV